MLAAIRTLGAVGILAIAIPAQVHRIALVNDPLSHGTLGNNLLSFDEAIRVLNAELSTGALSAAERAQIRGFSPAIDTIEIDFNITPLITLERQLTDIVGTTTTHVDVNVNGLNGRPVIEAGSVAIVFPTFTNHFHLRNFVVQNGQTAITWDSSRHYHPGVRMLVDNCLFVGQTQLGVLCRIPAFPPGEIEPGDIKNTVFQGLPMAIRVLDSGIQGSMDMTFSNNLFSNCQTALHVDMQGSGSAVHLKFDRNKILGAQDAVVVRRNAFADSALDLQFVYGQIVASRHAFDLQGETLGIGPTQLSLHHLPIQGGVGSTNYALRTSPPTGWFDVAMGEVEIQGNVLLQTGIRSTNLRIHNSTFDDGSLGLDSTGASPNLMWNLFDTAPVTIAARTTRAVSIAQCELISSPLHDQTAGGVTTLTGCRLVSSPITGTVANLNPAPGRWIGRASVVPDDPQLGTFVDLGVDLQAQTAAVWLLGLPVPTPITTAVPFRFYLNLAGPVLTLPGVWVAQQTLRLPIPNNGVLRGAELYAMPLVAPIAGQTWVPVLSFPAGGLFKIR